MRNFVIGFALAAAMCAVAGVAYASIPDSNGVVTACARPITGELRVIDTASPYQKCLSWEKKVELSAATAPPAPEVDRSCAAGEVMRGINANGSLKCAGFYVKTSINSTNKATAACDPGDIATGGGFSTAQPVASAPGSVVTGDDLTVWTSFTATTDVVSVAVCLDVAP